MQRKLGELIRNGYDSFETWRSYTNSRKEAKKLLDSVIERKGYKVVDSKQLKVIKEYSNETFDSPDYWPWLALYTEIKGEFIEGWIPDDYYSFELLPTFNPQPISMLSTIKTYDHRLFSDFSLQPLGVKISHSFYTHDQKKISFFEFKDILKKYDKEIVIKRDSGPSGRGILFKQAREVSKSDFSDNENYVIQPIAKQHKEINLLYSKSINTIRVATLITNNHSIDVVLVMMRFGHNGSRIDNVMSGGRFLKVDDHGQAFPNAFDEFGLDAGTIHPDTHYEYKNLKIPSFKEAINKCKEAHKLFPYVRFIAWDVYINENGEPRLLEWNARKPGMWRYESTLGPLWNGYLF